MLAENSRVPEFGGNGCPILEIGHHHLGALGDEKTRSRFPYATGGTGDDGNFSREACHSTLPRPYPIRSAADIERQPKRDAFALDVLQPSILAARAPNSPRLSGGGSARLAIRGRWDPAHPAARRV